MANRLARESSPYLLQHRDNPVDWYPWGTEALTRARDLDRPILLSVGYAACHWCHVMERESFEDSETAAYMNEHFVNVKVDREERPDVDAIYMEAVQGMTGHGGWPLTVFCDPDGVPFYGGTYFPPDESRGMPSFRMVMEAVFDAFANRRDELRARAPQMRQQLGAIGRIEPAAEAPGTQHLEEAVASLRAAADMERGGFGSAPKFPPSLALELLLARGVTDVVEKTLDAMMAGGIYDQLGGGFARYSVDSAWLVPHFEKMLYDNALLARAYLHGWQALGHERYRRICEETLDWALREMRGAEGGFYSALDADSEGEEGRFYVWSPAEIHAALSSANTPNSPSSANTPNPPSSANTPNPPSSANTPNPPNCINFPISQREKLMQFYGVSEEGNFEGRNVLHLSGGATAPMPDGLDDARRALLDARNDRPRPGLDDKRLTSWNALMIAALADAGAVLERADYLDAARGCAEFVLSALRDSEGHLLRTYKDGEGRLNGYLEDSAYLLEALLALYEATFEARWFEAAQALADAMISRFGDPKRGGFYSTSKDHEELIARRKEAADHPIPSGNSSAALGLLRLAALTGDRDYERWAEGVLRLFGRAAPRQPEAFAHMLRALDFQLSPTREVALVFPSTAQLTRSPSTTQGGSAEPPSALARVVRSAFRPHLVLAGGAEGTTTPALIRDRTTIDGKPAAYVCEHFACKAPVTTADELSGLL